MPVDGHSTILQLGRKGETACLVTGVLGERIPEEDELVIWLAHILAFLVTGHCGQRSKLSPEHNSF